MDLFGFLKSTIGVNKKRIMAFSVAAFVLGILFGNTLVHISRPPSYDDGGLGDEAQVTPKEEPSDISETQKAPEGKQTDIPVGEVDEGGSEEEATIEESVSEEKSEASSGEDDGEVVSEETEVHTEKEAIDDFTNKEYVAMLVTTYIPERARTVCGSYLSFQMAKAMDDGEPERTLRISIRFSHELSDSEVKDVEALGISFVRLDEEVLHAGTIYPASGPVNAINELAQWEIVVDIESTSTPIELP